jgi:hypothetical protein
VAPAANPYNEEDVKENPYLKRIRAIIDARKDDESLENMMRDIEEGDGVVKILEELSKEDSKEMTTDEAKAKAKEESESFSFEDSETSTVAPEHASYERTEKPTKDLTAKEKYERRKQRATENYKKRKKTLRDLRKRAYSTIVPIPTPLLDLANYLITKAQIGTYKIAQFAEEFKNLAKSRGFNANEFLSGIKAFYIDNAAAAITENPELLENFSDTKEIVGFHFEDTLDIKQPITVGSA